jgi:hypothetical protein
MASGILVLPTLREFISPAIPGKKYPIDTPASIARNIHKVR